MQDLSRTFKIVTVYSLIAVVLFLGFQWWEAEKKKPRVVIDAPTGQVQITLARDLSGHYFWRGQINGKDVEFLVDTGATQTSISQALAKDLGLQLQETQIFSTANGQVKGRISAPVTLSLEGGLRFERHRIAVMPAMDLTGLLGMDVLAKLRIEQQGKEMRLTAVSRR